MEEINIIELKEYIYLLSGDHEDESEDYNNGWNDALDELHTFLEDVEKTKLKEK